MRFVGGTPAPRLSSGTISRADRDRPHAPVLLDRDRRSRVRTPPSASARAARTRCRPPARARAAARGRRGSASRASRPRCPSRVRAWSRPRRRTDRAAAPPTSRRRPAAPRLRPVRARVRDADAQPIPARRRASTERRIESLRGGFTRTAWLGGAHHGVSREASRSHPRSQANARARRRTRRSQLRVCIRGRERLRGWRASAATPTLLHALPRASQESCCTSAFPPTTKLQTVGLLIWRLRKVFQEQPREYEVLVYDDGSTDATAETLAPYHKVMPLTRPRWHARRLRERRRRALPRGVAPHALSAPRRRDRAPGRLHRPARAPARAHQALRRRRGHRRRRAARRRADRAAARAHAAPRRAVGRCVRSCRWPACAIRSARCASIASPSSAT